MIIIKIIFFKFIFFSFFGYILECIYSSIIDKKITLDRGFLLGPYCPIYGACLIIIEKFQKLNNIYLIIISMIIISLIEYFSPYFLEKFFKKRWWDYSNKKINLNGRICLENIIIFSIGTVFIIRNISSFINENLIINQMNTVLIFFLYLVFSLDIFLTIKIKNRQ